MKFLHKLYKLFYFTKDKLEDSLYDVTSKYEEMRKHRERMGKVYVMVRYLKFTKKKLLKYLVLENQRLTESFIFYHKFERIAAFLRETLEFCASKTEDFVMAALKALNLKHSEFSKEYMQLICNILDICLQRRIGCYYIYYIYFFFLHIINC